MTLVEVMVSVFVLTLCTWMLSTTLMASARHAENKRERAWAVEAATNVVEQMHGLPFDEVFARYNESASDDPEDGVPGPHFLVEGLSPSESDGDGFVGRVWLPGEGPTLREDLDLPELGLPRDLNGDLVVDDLDHAADHRVLPVVVEVAWTSGGGERRFRVETLLSQLERGLR
jgi:hypothetical protein